MDIPLASQPKILNAAVAVCKAHFTGQLALTHKEKLSITDPRGCITQLMIANDYGGPPFKDRMDEMKTFTTMVAQKMVDFTREKGYFVDVQYGKSGFTFHNRWVAVTIVCAVTVLPMNIDVYPHRESWSEGKGFGVTIHSVPAPHVITDKIPECTQWSVENLEAKSKCDDGEFYDEWQDEIKRRENKSPTQVDERVGDFLTMCVNDLHPW